MLAGARRRPLLDSIPVLGICCFVGLYGYCASLYPGGSQADPQSVGFDWIYNYWCDLTSAVAIRGEANPARPFAIAAMTTLCAALAVFCIRFADTFSTSVSWRRTIKASALLSMSTAALTFTEHHDVAIVVSSLFGIALVLGLIREVARSPLTTYKLGGLACLLLIAANNYIYYSTHYLSALPLLQKLTFVAVLAWTLGISLRIGRLDTRKTKTSPAAS